jgi:hypothetical protein
MKKYGKGKFESFDDPWEQWEFIDYSDGEDDE